MAESDGLSSKPQPPMGKDPRSQFFDYLTAFSTCIICFQTLENPFLCPFCSKLYCYACISGWLGEPRQKKCCPNCSHTLRLDRLVKVCWFQELERLHRNWLEQEMATSGSSINVHVANKDPCPKHMKIAKLYCCNCEECVCDECVVDSESHLEHTFKSLEVIYNSDRKVVEKEFEEMTHYLGQNTLIVKKIDRSMELVRMVKKDKLNRIRSFANDAIKKIESEIETELNELQEQKTSLIDNILDIEQALAQMKITVAESTKNRLISEKKNILEKCNNIRKGLVIERKRQFCLNSKVPTFSEVSGIFIIENFPSIFGEKKKLYFSDGITDDNRVWRVKFTTMANATHLGIGLELVAGPPCKREYILKLVHTNVDKSVQRKSERFFKSANTVWGFPEFIALNSIIDDKYLKDDGSLELLFHIRHCD